MKYKLSLALGLAIGVLIYDLVKFSFSFAAVDWYRGVFMFVFTFVVLLFVPGRFLSRKKA